MQTQVCLMVLVAALATQISRLAPMFLSSKFKMSEGFERWLKYIPVSVLTAMIVPEFVIKSDGAIQINVAYLIAGLAALVIGLWKRSMLLSTIVGVVCVAFLRFSGF